MSCEYNCGSGVSMTKKHGELNKDLGLLLAIIMCMVVGGCRQSVVLSRAQGWHLADMVVSPRADYVAVSLFPLEQGYPPSENAFAVIELTSGVAVYCKRERLVRLRPLQWSQDGYRLLVRRIRSRGIPRWDLLTFDILRRAWSPVFPFKLWFWSAFKAQYSPDYSEIVFEGVRYVPPGKLTDDGIYVFSTQDGSLKARIAGTSDQLLAVAPCASIPDDYYVFFTHWGREVPALDSEYSIWVAYRRQGGRRQIVASVGSFIGSPVVSADGTHVAWLRKDKGRDQTTLMVFPWLVANKPFEVKIPDHIVELSWSPDGTMLLCRAKHSLWIYNRGSKQLRRISNPRGDERYGPCVAWLPDSRHFLFGRGGYLWLVDYETGKAEVAWELDRSGVR